MSIKDQRQSDPNSNQTTPATPAEEATLPAETGPESLEQGSTPARPADKETFRSAPEATGAPPALPAPRGYSGVLPDKEAPVHVAPNLLDLVIGVPVTPEEVKAVSQQRDLNMVVHQMLIIGLVISTTLLLAGLGLDLVLGREVPTIIPGFMDVFVRVGALRPSGFLALGLLVLIATPVLRVISSIIMFIYERDWRYAGITFLVFMVVVVSVILGKE